MDQRRKGMQIGGIVITANTPQSIYCMMGKTKWKMNLCCKYLWSLWTHVNSKMLLTTCGWDTWIVMFCHWKWLIWFHIRGMSWRIMMDKSQAEASQNTNLRDCDFYSKMLHSVTHKGSWQLSASFCSSTLSLKSEFANCEELLTATVTNDYADDMLITCHMVKIFITQKLHKLRQDATDNFCVSMLSDFLTYRVNLGHSVSLFSPLEC